MQKAAKEKTFLLLAIMSALFVCAPAIASSIDVSTGKTRAELFLLEGQNRTGQQTFHSAKHVENYDPSWGVALESSVAPIRGAGAVGDTIARTPQAAQALNRKLSALQTAQQKAVRTRTLADGRVRYYLKESPARNPGPTRGRSHVTEYDPRTGRVRAWEETYDHAGKVNRVHPKMLNGEILDLPHYPPTAKELGL